MKTGTPQDALAALRRELVALTKQIDRVLARETIDPGDRLDMGQVATNIRELLLAVTTAGLLVSAPTFRASTDEG